MGGSTDCSRTGGKGVLFRENQRKKKNRGRTEGGERATIRLKGAGWHLVWRLRKPEEALGREDRATLGGK